MVGEVLREFRLRRGLSQEELSFRAALHRTYVSLLERNKKSPTLDALFRLAAALEVRPSAILKRVEDRMDKARN